MITIVALLSAALTKGPDPQRWKLRAVALAPVVDVILVLLVLGA